MYFTAILVAVSLLHAPSISFAVAQDELSPAEMRYLALETEVALANNSQIGQYPFKVEIQNNSIVLTGEVPDNATRLAAEKTARQALRDYDVKVINKIRVIVPEAEPAPPGKPTPFDEEHMTKLRQLIDDHLPELADNVTVSFDTQPMPTIVLEGLIPTYEQKLELSRFIRRNFHDLPVVNNLRVRRVYEGDKSFYIASTPGASTPGEPDRATERVVEPRRRTRPNGVVVATVRQSDVEIAKQLGATLKADPVIKNCNIEVRVDDGVAWLAGRVESPGQKVRAIKLASVQPGVRYVVNQLDMRPISDEPSVISVKIPEPDDIVVYVKQYLTTRMLELEDADIRVIEDRVAITLPRDSDLTEKQIRDIEARLKRVPELKGYSIVIQHVQSKGVDR
jgi:osmotically-inducible protein OsmY